MLLLWRRFACRSVVSPRCVSSSHSVSRLTASRAARGNSQKPLREFLAVDRGVADGGIFSHLGETASGRLLALGSASVRRREILYCAFDQHVTTQPTTNSAILQRGIGDHPSVRARKMASSYAQGIPRALFRRHNGYPSRPQPVQTASTPKATLLPPESSYEWPRHSVFDSEACVDLFESNTFSVSHVFVDRLLGNCFICREPVGNVGSHTGYWDHVSRVVALRLCIAYRRSTTTTTQVLPPAAAPPPRGGASSALSSSCASKDLLILGRSLVGRGGGDALVLSTHSSSSSLAVVLWHPESVLSRSVVDLHLPIQCAVLWAQSWWTTGRWAMWSLAAYQRHGGHPRGTRPKALPYRSSFDGVMTEALRCMLPSEKQKAPHQCVVGPQACGEGGFAAVAHPPHTASPALACPQTMLRLLELHALLQKLVHWGVLTYCFSGPERPGASNEGERCFRGTVSTILTPLLPPLSAQAQTRTSQKCWGRQNWELLFDLLDLGRTIQRRMLKMPASAVASTKDQKAAVMRQMVYQLHCVVDGCGGDTPSFGSALAAPAAERPIGRPPPTVLAALCELTLHRLAFELVHLRTAILMDEAAGGLWADLGFPTSDDLSAGVLR